MKLTIRTRLIGLYCLVFAVLFTLMAGAVYRSVRHNEHARMDAKLQQYAFGIEHELTIQLDEGDSPDTLDFISVRPAVITEARFTLYGARRQFVAGDSILRLPIPTEELSSPLFGYRDIGNVKYRTLWVELEPAPEEDYLLLIVAPMEELEEGLEKLEILLILLLPVSLLLAGAASWLIISRAFRPLARMIQAADRISASNLDERLPLPDAHDEVRGLGQVFNSMLERLHAAFNTQRRFIADASHELRTPLAVIRTELEFANRTASNSDQRQSISIAMEEVDHLTALTTNLLTLARLDSGADEQSVQKIDLNQLAADCVERLLPLAIRKGIAFDLRLGDQVVVSGDLNRLDIALKNILENAMKYSPPESTVAVRVECDAESAKVVVEDQGPGIETEALPHIFERFYRALGTRNPADGSGLGLAIAQEIVHRQGGQIFAENMEGKGTRFSLVLPVALNALILK